MSMSSYTRATRLRAWRLGAACFLPVALGWAASADPAELAIQQPGPAEQYRKLCAPCHGATGRGDGPAAIALTPKPSNFSDSSWQASRKDEQLAKSLTDGTPPMPAFGKQLSPSQISALVAYVRELGKKPK
jgi:mono/diheme cytochrome c family protein